MSMAKEIGWVGLGGAIGTSLRYSLYELLRIDTIWITMLCNIIGALLLALLYSYITTIVTSHFYNKLKLLLGVGLLGGFTTFSTISLDLYHIMTDDKIIVIVALYMFGTFLGGFLASLFGYKLIAKLAKGGL